MQNRKGQFGLYGLISVVIMVVAIAATMPLIISEINNLTGQGILNPSEVAVWNLIPLVILLGILAGVFFVLRPAYQ